MLPVLQGGLQDLRRTQLVREVGEGPRALLAATDLQSLDMRKEGGHGDAQAVGALQGAPGSPLCHFPKGLQWGPSLAFPLGRCWNVLVMYVL